MKEIPKLINKNTLYNEIVNGKRMRDIAYEYDVSIFKVQVLRHQLIKDGKLVFHHGMRPVPKNLDDRESFWINRIKSWKGVKPKELKKMIRVIKTRNKSFMDCSVERTRKKEIK